MTPIKELILKYEYYNLKHEKINALYSTYTENFCKHFHKELQLLDTKNILHKESSESTEIIPSPNNEACKELNECNLCKALHKRLILATHPDKTQNTHFTSLFQLVEEAYNESDILKLILLCEKTFVEYADVVTEDKIAEMEQILARKKNQMHELKSSVVWEWNTTNNIRKKQIEQKLKLLAIGSKTKMIKSA